MPHSAAVLARAGALGVPRIHFGVGTANLLGLMGAAGADVVGVDWRTPLGSAIPVVGERSVQGNLDPTLVFAPTEVMLARAAEILDAGKAAKGHIFNLGHGVLPDTESRPARPADRVRAGLSGLSGRTALRLGGLLRGAFLAVRLRVVTVALLGPQPHPRCALVLLDVEVVLTPDQRDQLGEAVVARVEGGVAGARAPGPPGRGAPSRRPVRCRRSPRSGCRAARGVVRTRRPPGHRARSPTGTPWRSGRRAPRG